MPQTSLTSPRNSTEMESHSRVKQITKMNIRCLIRRLASLVLLSVAITSLPAVTAEKSLPNIVIVVLDDAGFSDYSFLGSRIQTPTIDALAANGLTLTNFMCNRAALPHARTAHRSRSTQCRAWFSHCAGTRRADYRALSRVSRPRFDNLSRGAQRRRL